MIEFARNTPPEVTNWLRAQLGAMPNHPALIALATDERMSVLWAEIKKGQLGALTFVQLAAHFSAPAILSVLQEPPEERVSLSWPRISAWHRSRRLCDFAGVLAQRRNGALGRTHRPSRRAPPCLRDGGVRTSKGEAECLRLRRRAETGRTWQSRTTCLSRGAFRGDATIVQRPPPFEGTARPRHRDYRQRRIPRVPS